MVKVTVELPAGTPLAETQRTLDDLTRADPRHARA